MRVNIYWGFTKHQVVLLKCYPVRSFQLCREGNIMPVFHLAELRYNDVTCLAWGLTGSEWQSWLWIQLRSVSHSVLCLLSHTACLGRGPYGREGVGWPCVRIALTCVSSLISQQSCKEGTVIILIWQVRKLSFRAERHFWACQSNPRESFSRSTGFHGNIVLVKADNGLGALWTCSVP